jgi:hypothetical protein
MLPLTRSSTTAPLTWSLGRKRLLDLVCAKDWRGAGSVSRVVVVVEEQAAELSISSRPSLLGGGRMSGYRAGGRGARRHRIYGDWRGGHSGDVKRRGGGGGEVEAVAASRRGSRRHIQERQWTSGGGEEGAATGLEGAGAEKKERRGWEKEGASGGWGLGWAMTWMAERPENGTENKILYGKSNSIV